MQARLGLFAFVCSAALLSGGCAPPAAAAGGHAKHHAPQARRTIWTIGDPWGLPSREDGQQADRPLFARRPALCVAEGSAAQCSGGAGAVSFHLQRPDTTTVPAAEYRNMMVLQRWNPEHTYAFNYQLVPGAVYDVRFRTVNGVKDDAKDVQSLIWQVHAGDGSVNLALGLIDRDGRHNEFFFNYGMREGDDNHWHGAAPLGGADRWEIQFRNAADERGWVDMYRNGRRQVHYRGPVVKTTRYDLMSFGLYYYDWKSARSTVRSTDITFTDFELATIPGPLSPSRR